MDSVLGHLLGAAGRELPAVSGRHKATSVPGTQGRPSLEINATYGGSTDLKNNNFFLTGWIQSITGEGRRCAVWEARSGCVIWSQD